jgi:adenine-specific DNA-methyltransferase
MDKNQIEKIDLDKVDWRGSREFFESLGEALDKLDDKDESYDFTWVGKRKAIIEAGSPINKTLRPDVGNSKNWDTTENLFIEGDNLDALKLLQESYLGKVKMIYIDPPYNTGKDFVYHDNFKTESAEWDENTEYKDESGNIQFKKNEKTNGRYHSDWLSMMYPRLKLSRNLLTDDGVIFISIDDNEQANLKKLCDEIFGEDNFIAELPTVMNLKGNNDQFGFAGTHEYTLVYSKNFSNLGALNGTSLSEDDILEYKWSDTKGKYKKGATLMRTGESGYRAKRPKGYYPIYVSQALDRASTNRLSENDIEVYPKTKDGVEMSWRRSPENLSQTFDDFIIIATETSIAFYKKQRLEKDILSGKKPKSLFYKPEYSSGNGTAETKNLFLGKRFFDNPKPISLIKDFIKIGSNKDSLILDFFSGSATTAHATMQLNAEDGGKRKWIMVQLPETTDENSEAFKAGYKNIPEISRERIRRAGDKIAAEHPDAKIDYGFRALKIADTNYKEVYKSAGEYQQATLLDTIDNIKDDRSELDLLYGVLTQSAFELNRLLETRDIVGVTVYLYDYFSEISGLAACFASSVPEETIKAIAKLKPLTAVFRDSSFTDSQAKVNLAEHFRILSPDTKVKVI